jgi:glycosidase
LRLRFSDNHDQLRTTGQAGLPAAMAASAVMFTLDGVPLLYNGMEIGDTVESLAPALFERAPIQWQVAERRPHVAEYYRQLAMLRRAHPAFTRGEVRWLENSDAARVVSFERAVAGQGEGFTVVVNLSSQPFSGTVNAPAGVWEDITPLAASAAVTLPKISLAAWEFRVFQRR